MPITGCEMPPCVCVSEQTVKDIVFNTVFELLKLTPDELETPQQRSKTHQRQAENNFTCGENHSHLHFKVFINSKGMVGNLEK